MASRARPFSTEGGRKWVVMWFLLALGVLMLASTFVQAIWLDDLDTGQLTATYTVMGSLAGLFMGVQGAIDFRAAGSPDVAASDPPTDIGGFVDDEAPMEPT